jgi:cytochrome P450
MQPLPGVDPAPPRAPGLPWLGSAPALLRDPTAFFQHQRGRLGDTFLTDAFGYRLFCVFSPDGVRRLYELPEEVASFGLATYTLVFKHKVPIELVAGRRHRPHDLFGGSDVEFYLDTLERAVESELSELGAAGRFEIFEFARRLGHRLGLACWAGSEAAESRTLDRLIPLLNQLDASDSFVRPVSTLISMATRKRREWAALRGIEATFDEILLARERSGIAHDDFLQTVFDAWADVSPEERRRNTARDIVVIHMGAQSNLYAALAWTLVNLLLHPEVLERVQAGDDELLEHCANESIRMAQRSLTLRQVMRPMEFDDGSRKFVLEPGVLIATMLSVTNTTAAPGLERFDPDHYEGRRLVGVELPARELVSTFGHGRHSCPAQRFSISAIRIALRRLLDTHSLTQEFSAAAPRRRQIGGVARSEKPCFVSYRKASAP